MNCKTTTRSLVSCSTRVPEGQGSYHSDTQSDVTSWTAGTSNSQVNASPIGALLTRGCVKGSTQESVVAEQAMLLELPRARSCCSTEACKIPLLSSCDTIHTRPFLGGLVQLDAIVQTSCGDAHGCLLYTQLIVLFHRKTAPNCILYISKQSFFFCPTLLGTVASRHQYLLPVESRSQLCVASANVEPQPEVIETSSF